MTFALRIPTLALALAVSGPVFAADLYVEEAPPIEPVATYSGWYLRGDIGYVFKSRNQGTWDFYNQFPGVGIRGIDDTFRYDRLDLGAAASFSGGVGYRFNDYLRADATLDFFHAKVSGGTACPSYIRTDPQHGLLPVGSDCYYDENGSADVWAPMANAYVDLPSMGAITPYLGLGIGAAYVKYGTLNAQEVCPNCTAGYTPYSSTQEGLDSWRLAGSAMAGLSYRLSDNFLLDAGYKYTRVAGGNAFAYDAADQKFGAKGAQVRDNGFDFHALRVGVRYELN